MLEVIMFIFFFKQKTAYEILADWSSDVCSSDLGVVEPDLDTQGFDLAARNLDRDTFELVLQNLAHPDLLLPVGGPVSAFSDGRPPLRIPDSQIGRASCRERV